VTLYQGKKEAGSQPGRVLPGRASAPWPAVVASLTLLGCSGAGLVALLVGAKGLALGFFLGGVLSIANFIGLKLLVEKAFPSADRSDPKVFWTWTGVRWMAFAVVCWGLLSISRECLLGALVGYLIFLATLGWVGVKLKPRS
jgi:hypothetical protein